LPRQMNEKGKDEEENWTGIRAVCTDACMKLSKGRKEGKI